MSQLPTAQSTANPGKTVVIAGGSGFVGRALYSSLHTAGFRPVIVSRQPQSLESIGPEAISYDQLDRLEGCLAVVNLAGANLAEKRWSARRKRQLRDSRIQVTQRLSQWAAQASNRPQTFVSASAIGYYGDTADQIKTENDEPGEDFGAQLCSDWEAAVALPSDIRTVVLRIGIVLAKDGGALGKMLLPFRLGLGGRLGSGKQWMSWITRHDLVQLIQQVIVDPSFCGTYNAVAPEPVRNKDFASALGKSLQRPSIVPVPASILRLSMGELSSLLLDSQRVVPHRLNARDYPFEHADLSAAMQYLFR